MNKHDVVFHLPEPNKSKTLKSKSKNTKVFFIQVGQELNITLHRVEVVMEVCNRYPLVLILIKLEAGVLRVVQDWEELNILVQKHIVVL